MPKAKDPMKTEREWYDTHEFDYEAMPRVGLERSGRPRATFALRLEPEVIDEVRRLAEDQGMGPTQLVRAWVLERLRAELTGEGAVDPALERKVLELVRRELPALLDPTPRHTGSRRGGRAAREG